MRTTIDIDIDVYQVLTKRFTTEAPDCNAVIRQLLDMTPAEARVAPAVQATRSSAPEGVGRAQEGTRRAPSTGSTGDAVSRIALLGATGMIGQQILTEALARGVKVTAILRDAGRLDDRPGLAKAVADANDPDLLAAALAGADAVAVAVKWADADVVNIVAALRKAQVKRAIFVIGCGTLRREDGRLHFVHSFEEKGMPAPPTVPALKVLDTLRAAADLEWTAISCPKSIGPGDRTGAFRVGGDHMLIDAEGDSRITAADFAVAILDELERPDHVRGQFTVAY